MKIPEILAEPWAITSPAFESLVQVARAGGGFRDAKAAGLGLTPEALMRMGEDRQADELDVRTDGVAVIPVRGSLTRRSYWRGDRAAYEWIGARVQEALERYNVKAIVLEVDSPGGQVNGTEELASMIRAARGQKPITAYVQGEASSAAYWIASAAERIVVGRTSMVGSIGVIWSYIDWSAYDARVGIQEIAIVSSQSPDKALDPKTAHGRARVQTTVDQLAGVFVADVARNRGVDEPSVLAHFGQGWIRVGQDAVSARMADRVGTFAAAITDEPDFDPTSSPPPLAGGQEGNMSTINLSDLTAAYLEQNHPLIVVELRSGYAAIADRDADIKSAVDAAVTEAVAAASAAATAAAVDAERTRVIGIQEAAKGMGLAKLVAELVGDSKITVDAAKARLFEALQAARKGGLDALSQDEAELDAPYADSGNEDAAATTAAQIKAANDYAFRHAARR